jgi:hypothetical protein
MLNLFLNISDGAEQLPIHLLLIQKLMDKLLCIANSCRNLNVGESVLNNSELLHLAVHLIS